MIAPIRTAYRGITYRSRLEARWAIFFTKLNIAYEYEKAGFHLGALGYYTLDFWLPKQRCWLEVKPGFDVAARSELDKPEALHKLTSSTVVVLAGNVYPGAYSVIVFAPTLTLDLRVVPDHTSMFARCDACGNLSIVVTAPGCTHWLAKVELQSPACVGHAPMVATHGANTLLAQAYTAARCARFE